MSAEIIRLPRRFPIGTRYVIEGREGSIQLRYLEFPDGRKVDLPTDVASRSKVRAAAGRLRSPRTRDRKKI